MEPSGKAPAVQPPPTGVVTFVLTDVEGSTTLMQTHPAVMPGVLAGLAELIRRIAAEHGGHLPKDQGEGDASCVVFSAASHGLRFTLDLQRAIAGMSRPEGVLLRVRIGCHTGEAELHHGNYYGLAINRCARVRSIAHGDQILLTQATATLAARNLPDGASLADLGIHRLKDLFRPDRVFQLSHTDLPAEFPPLRSLDARPHNLPVQLTSFVGREAELTEVRRLLSRARLVTLTGTGGSGKTRLALQVGAEVLDEHPGGVWLVELAALSDSSLVAQEVARSLRIAELPGRSAQEGLIEHVGDRQVLILLDNCEHVAGACAELASSLTTSCPGLRLLATSREPLNLGGEVLWRVPSLGTPSTNESSLDEVWGYDAIRLFCERAARARQDFELTTANAQAVGAICRLLDGIPLAIELAAARSRILSPEEIASRLHDRFGLLVSGDPRATPRQRTLRATIDWSYEMLQEAERLLLGRLAVFAGPFSLEATEEVCPGEGIDPSEVLVTLSALVDKSLVVSEYHGDRSLFRLLETVRHYALEKLGGAGPQELDRLHTRHLASYRSLAERVAPKLIGSDLKHSLELLEAEHDNFRAALQWSLREGGDRDVGLKLAGALGRFWHVRGYLTEGLAWIEEALSQAVGDGRTRAVALLGGGDLARFQGDHDVARARFDEALALLGEEDDPRLVAVTLANLGSVARGLGDYTSARSYYDQCLSLYRELGDERGVRVAINDLGLVALQRGDYDSAQTLLETSLARAREAKDLEVTASSLTNLGEIAFKRGAYKRARGLREEALVLYGELGAKRQVSVLLGSLGVLSHRDGDNARARTLFEESAEISRELGDRRSLAISGTNLGALALGEGNFDLARSLLEKSVEVSRLLHDNRTTARALHLLGEVALNEGEAALASSLFEKGLALWREVGDSHGVATSLVGLANALTELENPGAARPLLDEALGLARELGARTTTASALEALARLAELRGDAPGAEALLRQALAAQPERSPAACARTLELLAGLAAGGGGGGGAGRAGVLFGAAEALREASNSPVPPAFRARYESGVDAVRAALGPKGFDRTWQEGGAMGPAAAVDYALGRSS